MILFQFRNENENGNEIYDQNQSKYSTFFYDKSTDDNEFDVNQHYDDYYDTTDQEDFDYLLADDESLY